ncbi:hypothetical protein TPA0598_04_03240 [Streptomyces lydicamycinicus]|uniref:Uncharacterized protein n=1 Tax=Streptomyces lydicamycinicus TaxID=1546107 RepID=A0A0P4R7Z1_9ACTN|nr:hypothetical protein [Streptomyces lydicamycinicus]GAO08688.1 hypothetical protein TPA0598_04_03240 [Streptomyces lydicamycinicus]
MTTVITEPPAAAVARDAHWSAKMARLKARKLPERSLRLCDDDEAKKNATDAALELAKARTTARAESVEQGIAEADREEWMLARPDVVAAQLRLDAAERVLEDATVVLTFRALPRPAWEQLLRDHPPTEAQADQGMEYNVETYPAALIASCHIERDQSGAEVPGMSEQEAQELLDAWPDSEAKALFTSALLVNQTLRADLGKG